MLRIARKERKGATVPRWTIHDLRRTAASGMARLGQPVQVVAAALNHKSGTIKGVAAVYNRYSYADEKPPAPAAQSEERRVGTGGISPCETRWWPAHYKK